DRWATGQVEPPAPAAIAAPSVPTPTSRLGLSWAWLAGAVAVIVVAGLRQVVSSTWFAPAIDRLEWHDRSVIARDRAGRDLWEYVVPGVAQVHQQDAILRDLDGDGRNDVVVSASGFDSVGTPTTGELTAVDHT